MSAVRIGLSSSAAKRPDFAAVSAATVVAVVLMKLRLFMGPIPFLVSGAMLAAALLFGNGEIANLFAFRIVAPAHPTRPEVSVPDVATGLNLLKSKRLYEQSSFERERIDRIDERTAPHRAQSLVDLEPGSAGTVRRAFAAVLAKSVSQRGGGSARSFRIRVAHPLARSGFRGACPRSDTKV